MSEPVKKPENAVMLINPKKEPPEPAKLRLVLTIKDGKGSRMIKVVVRGKKEPRYTDRHRFVFLAEEFKGKFGREIPGFNLNYEGIVRGQFNMNTFLLQATPEEIVFVQQRLDIGDLDDLVARAAVASIRADMQVQVN